MHLRDAKCDSGTCAFIKFGNDDGSPDSYVVNRGAPLGFCRFTGRTKGYEAVSFNIISNGLHAGMSEVTQLRSIHVS